MMKRIPTISRRRFLRQSAGAVAAPLILNSKSYGAEANDKIVLGCIGMGGQGRYNLGELLKFEDVHVAAVCDVVGPHRRLAKNRVDLQYGNKDCQQYVDFREILHRDDIDAVMIAPPDHWHAVMAIEAMKCGKDVYCEKPETRTIREGRRMAEVVERYGRVFSGGSQRVWGDYHWAHRMVRGGALGEVKEAWVNVGDPSGPCYLEPQEIPPDVDWEMWLGPAPWRPFHQSLLTGEFRPYRDYSGGGTTDWGCHGFGGALFALGLHETGPVEVTIPGTEHEQLTVKFANGVRIHHKG
ncbi:MAG: Gfo/Idh/MocA family oxidoreductase, partial [Pirellulales bacterium]|nr:Gfo/Idh/MocA family oxidoreductase [Pirellulales bacterium]